MILNYLMSLVIAAVTCLDPLRTTGTQISHQLMAKSNDSAGLTEIHLWESLKSNATSEGSSGRSYLASFDPVNNVTKKFFWTRNRLIDDGFGSEIPEEAETYEGKPGKIHSGKRHEGKIRNFLAWDTLEDSEREMRVHYNRITAKETVITTGINRETGKRQGLKLRQLTDGLRFIQLIYTLEGEIQDCEYLKEESIVRKFLRAFRKDVEKAKTTFYVGKTEDDDGDDEEGEEDGEEKNEYLEEDEGTIERYPGPEEGEDEEEREEKTFGQGYRNVTFQIIRTEEDLPMELREWMNYSALKKKCRENHRMLKKLAYDSRHGSGEVKNLAEEHIQRIKRFTKLNLIFPGTKWCGKGNAAAKYTDVGGFFAADKCCRAHDHCYPLIKAFRFRYGYYNVLPFTISHCKCDLRRKRDIMDVLLVPGTKWCGKGRRATKYTSLGGFSRTDKCCRIHDTMCPHWIGSMEEKYGLFNWRINTIMHCRCDKRFRACLKMAKTGTANFVGKLFFNVVQTKCFVLKPKEVCLKYSWWGKCEKKEYRKQAHLKDNLSY